MTCKDCIHYGMCLEKFRKNKSYGFYEMIDEKEYFSHADDCDFYRADVVPISEVEKAKQEVAREIFDEIEKNTEFCIRFIENTTLFDNEEEIRKAKLECYRDCVEYFKKLKKKYIGE